MAKTPHSFPSSSAQSTSTPATPGFWAVSHERARLGMEAWSAKQRDSLRHSRGTPGHDDRPKAMSTGHTATPVPSGVSLGSTLSRGPSLAPLKSLIGKAAESSAGSLALHSPPEGFDYIVTDVAFVWRQFSAQVPNSVYVTGSFTSWSDSVALRSDPEDTRVWSCTLALPAGQHQYKFIVDGVWRHASDQPITVDKRGIVNNILTVLVELCGDESCFCSRMVLDTMSIKSQSGGGIDGSEANVPAGKAHDEEEHIRNRRLSRGCFSPKTQLELKRHTGVALEYKEKPRVGIEKLTHRAYDGKAIHPRILTETSDFRETDGRGRVLGHRRESLSEDGSRQETMQDDQHLTVNAMNQCPVPEEGDSLDDDRSCVSDSIERPPFHESLDDSEQPSDSTVFPAFQKTFMHHEVNDTPFEVTVVPNARDLLSESRMSETYESRRSPRLQKAPHDHSTHDADIHSDFGLNTMKDDMRFRSGRSRSNLECHGGRPSSTDQLDAVRGSRHDFVLHLATMAAASEGSEKTSLDWNQWQSLEVPKGEFIGKGSESREHVRVGLATMTQRTGSSSCFDTTLHEGTSRSTRHPSRRHKFGRDGDDIIPEGAMSRVSSLNEIRQQYAQLTQTNEVCDTSSLAERAAESTQALHVTQGAPDSPSMKAECSRVNSETTLESSWEQHPIYRRNSANSMDSSQRPIYEFQYAVRAEFSTPLYGFDPQKCHEGIGLLSANQCAYVRPHHKGLYRTVQGMLRAPPGSYFEVVFAPDVETPVPMLNKTPERGTALGTRHRSVVPSRATSSRPKKAAACIGLVSDAAHLPSHSLIGSISGTIGLHTSGFVVRTDQEGGAVEWVRVQLKDSVLASNDAAHEFDPVLETWDGVVGVLRTQCGHGVRFFIDGREVVPANNVGSQLANNVFHQGEWICHFASDDKGDCIVRPAVSLFAETARVYAAFSHDALRFAAEVQAVDDGTAGGIRENGSPILSHNAYQCLDGVSLDKKLPLEPNDTG